MCPFVVAPVVVLALMLCAQSALASTYYVSPTGSNKNAGTSSTSPWQTISRVDQSTYKPGDSILFQGGSSLQPQRLDLYGACERGNREQPDYGRLVRNGAGDDHAGSSDAF